MYLHHKFISAIAAVSILITGVGAVPARADDDVTRAVAAILGIAIVGAAINNHKDHREQPYVAPRRKPRLDRFHNPRVKPRPVPHLAKRKALPQHCLRSFRTDRGNVRMFGQRCLERNYRAVNALPNRCARRVWTDSGRRLGFGVKCLRNAGYKIARS